MRYSLTRPTSGTIGVWPKAETASIYGAGPPLSNSPTVVMAGSGSFSTVNCPQCTPVGRLKAEMTALVSL